MKNYILLSTHRLFCIFSSLFLIFLISACTPDNKEASGDIKVPSPAISEQASVLDIPDAYSAITVPPVLSFTNIDCLAQDNSQYAKYGMASLGDVSYYIDREDYTEEERTEIIYHLDQVMTLLVEKYGFQLPRTLDVYVGSKVVTQGYDGNICINSDDLGRLESLIAMMTGLSSELANYGLCYGFGIHIADEIMALELINLVSVIIPDDGWFDGIRFDVSERELAEYFSVEKNLILLDFMVPVFEPEYFNPDDNLHAASAAYLFTKYIIEKYGINTLISMIHESATITLDFDISYTEKCNEWLQEIGALCRREIPEVVIRCGRDYGYTYASCKYVFHTRDMRSYIPVGFVDIETEDVLSYPKIIFLLTTGEKDLYAVKEYLSLYFETDLEQIPCYYESKPGTSRYENNHIIYTYTYYHFVHEYIHYITYDGYNNPHWLSEGIAEFACNYISNGLMMHRLQLFVEYWKDAHASSNHKSFRELFLELYSSEERDTLIGIYNDLSSYYVYRGMTSQKSFDNIYPDKTEGGFMTYSESGSLINYLINTYGADTFFSLYKGEISLDEAYDRDINELYAEWAEYMHTEYEDARLYLDTNMSE